MIFKDLPLLKKISCCFANLPSSFQPSITMCDFSLSFIVVNLISLISPKKYNFNGVTIQSVKKNIVMKKIITLLVIVGMFSFQSCTTKDSYVDTDKISKVFELKNINFAYNPTDGYTIYQKFTPNIYASDVVLI